MYTLQSNIIRQTMQNEKLINSIHVLDSYPHQEI